MNGQWFDSQCLMLIKEKQIFVIVLSENGLNQSSIKSSDSKIINLKYIFIIIMISSYTITNNLLSKIVYFTAKSARQTTPNLIKNPRLSQRGIVKPPNKSFAYNIPENIANRHLYWNNTLQNKIRRKEYNAHRLYKLGIKAIHDQKGNPLHNRTVQEILYELTNLKLIKESFGRTLVNLREICQRFPQTANNDNREIVHWTLNQIDQRNLPSLDYYHFSTYVFLRKQLGAPPTERLIFHIYKWIEGQVQTPSGKFKPKNFLNNIQYVFSQQLNENLNDILYKKQIEFKLFEDLQPTNKPLQELLPKLFTQNELKTLKSDANFKIQKYSFLSKIPGGKGLLQRIKNAQ